MAVTRKVRSNSESLDGIQRSGCLVCGLAIPPNTMHCPGSDIAYSYKPPAMIVQHHQVTHHHAYPKLTPSRERNLWVATLWDNCWRCGKAMGCSACVKVPICRVCLVVTDRDWYVSHGSISNDSYSLSFRRMAPDLRAYPPGWSNAYALANPETACKTDEQLFQNFKRVRTEFLAKPMPSKKSLRKLEKERNRQVAALR